MRLKWGETEYKGRLVSVDLYMNIQLNNTEEFINGQSSGQLGQVLIRCAFERRSGGVQNNFANDGVIGVIMFFGSARRTRWSRKL